MRAAPETEGEVEAFDRWCSCVCNVARLVWARQSLVEVASITASSNGSNGCSAATEPPPDVVAGHMVSAAR
jgi:hypothetical protein